MGARPPEGGKAGSNTSGIFLGNGTELNWTGDVSMSVTGRAFMKGVGAQDGANFIIKNGSLDVTVSGEYKENGRYSLEGLSFVEHINGLDSKTVAQVDGDVNVKVTATNGSGVATALRAERTLNGMTADADMSKRDLVEVRLGSLEKASKLSFSAVTHDAVNSEQDTDKFAAGIMAGNATVTLAGSSLAVSTENHGGTGYGKGVNAWGMGIYDFAKVNADVTGAISVKASADSGTSTARRTAGSPACASRRATFALLSNRATAPTASMPQVNSRLMPARFRSMPRPRLPGPPAWASSTTT